MAAVPPPADPAGEEPAFIFHEGEVPVSNLIDTVFLGETGSGKSHCTRALRGTATDRIDVPVPMGQGTQVPPGRCIIKTEYAFRVTVNETERRFQVRLWDTKGLYDTADGHPDAGLKSLVENWPKDVKCQYAFLFFKNGRQTRALKQAMDGLKKLRLPASTAGQSPEIHVFITGCDMYTEAAKEEVKNIFLRKAGEARLLVTPERVHCVGTFNDSTTDYQRFPAAETINATLRAEFRTLVHSIFVRSGSEIIPASPLLRDAEGCSIL